MGLKDVTPCARCTTSCNVSVFRLRHSSCCGASSILKCDNAVYLLHYSCRRASFLLLAEAKLRLGKESDLQHICFHGNKPAVKRKGREATNVVAATTMLQDNTAKEESSIGFCPAFAFSSLFLSLLQSVSLLSSAAERCSFEPPHFLTPPLFFFPLHSLAL